MKTRIKILRKDSGLTQSEFGKKIGISNTAVSKIESGENNVSEQTIKNILLQKWDGKYVNEQWLRSGAGGDGNMYLPEDMTRFYNIGKLGDEENEFKQFYLNMMMHLPDAFWDYIYKEFKRFSDEKRE